MNERKKQKANSLLNKMIQLRSEVYDDGLSIYSKWGTYLINKNFKVSALNLAFYLALRSRDIRNIQEELMPFGLSSLGRLESRVMETMDAVISSLVKITGRKVKDINYPPIETFIQGRNQLRKNTISFFGNGSKNRIIKIMITIPASYATDYKGICRLIEKGMDVARINCAHDNKDVWKGIIDNIKKANTEFNTDCKVLMDLAGPKARINWLFYNESVNRVQVGEYFTISNINKVEVDSPRDIVMGCSLPEILQYLKLGDRVLIDDGVIEGIIEYIIDKEIIVKISKVANPRGVRLRVDKGLNFPDSDIDMDIITNKDKKDLDFACEHSDIIGVSYVKNAKDIELAQEEIAKRVKDPSKTPIMAKIETSLGINNLPEIIVAGAGKSPFAIMIARGDLAVETGYLRLAELQQEITWICEAADIPVVWATQVLDNMVKTGIPTRAEVTDAAEGGGRSECVMINKGPYLEETVVFLGQLLEKMQAHHYKKTSQLRALNLAKEITFIDE